MIDTQWHIKTKLVQEHCRFHVFRYIAVKYEIWEFLLFGRGGCKLALVYGTAKHLWIIHQFWKIVCDDHDDVNISKYILTEIRKYEGITSWTVVKKKLRPFIVRGCRTTLVEKIASWNTWSKISHYLSEKNKNTPFYIRPTTLIWASTDRHMMNSFSDYGPPPLNTNFSPQHHWVSILLRYWRYRSHYTYT